MHEIIHLSASATANHLHSHFYNAQESYFVYDDDSVKTSRVDPDVLFRRGKGFTPRALVWEMRGGYGAMKELSGVYQEEDQSFDQANWTGGNVETLKTEESVPKSEYQKALDSGLQPSALTKSNTKYWSDYLNIFYHPSSLQTLSNWEYHPDKYPKGQARGGSHTFEDFNVGVDQWNEIDNIHRKEYLEETFRPVLELCDQISGLSLSTEVDSAWGGFTAELLANLRDDHVPKIPIFTWALHNSPDSKLSRQQQISRIRTTNSLVQNSTLYIPMQPPSRYSLQQQQLNIDPDSRWHLGALYNTVHESFSLLSSLRDGNRVSMQEITDGLQCGSNRNIVGQVQSAISTHLIDFSLAPSKHIFAKSGLIRPSLKPKSQPAVAKQPMQLIDYLNATTVADPWESFFKKEQLMEDGTAEKSLVRYELNQPYSLPASHPDFINDEDEIYASLAITDSPHSSFKEMSRTVSLLKVDDREELRDDLSNISDQYVWGWNDSDSESDV